MSVSVATRLREETRRSWFDPELELLLRTTIDDLVKYHIVRLLRERPDTTGDEAFFAAALGFHSVAKTRSALEALVKAGVLDKWTDPATGQSDYALSSNATMHRRLDRIYDITPESPLYGELLRRLAARSLHRADTGAKKRRPTLTQSS